MDNLLNLTGFNKMIEAMNKEDAKEKQKNQLKEIKDLENQFIPIEREIDQFIDLYSCANDIDTALVLKKLKILDAKIVSISTQEIELSITKIYKGNIKRLGDLSNRIDNCLFKLLRFEEQIESLKQTVK